MSPDSQGLPGLDGIVVRSRATFVVQAGAPSAPPDAESSGPSLAGTVPVVVSNSAASSMSLDTSQFSAPTISNALLDFGNLIVSSLFDNDLNQCGTSGHQHCGTALIRIYTTGTAGAGLYNSTDSFGAPITAGISSPLSAVGLNATGAAVLQTIAIPEDKHVVRLTDFTPTPQYDVKADFTDAGAGSYSTTIVLEYALAP